MFLLVFLLALAPLHTDAALTINQTGFAPGNLLYSKESFFAGDEVRVYTIVYNSADAAIEGNVEFLDTGTVFGTTAFVIPAGGVKDIGVIWKPTVGAHTVTARFVGTKRAGVPVQLGYTIAGEKSGYVDADTDRDLIGNKADSDDDNDGLSDIKEIAAGTNPAAADSDNDGVKDSEDPAPLIAANPIETVAVADTGIPAQVKNTAQAAVEKVESARQQALAHTQDFASRTSATLPASERPTQTPKTTETIGGSILSSLGVASLGSFFGDLRESITGFFTQIKETNPDGSRTPFTYGKLALAQVAIFTLSSPLVLYGGISFATLFILRRIFRRKKYSY